MFNHLAFPLWQISANRLGASVDYLLHPNLLPLPYPTLPEATPSWSGRAQLLRDHRAHCTPQPAGRATAVPPRHRGCPPGQEPSPEDGGK